VMGRRCAKNDRVASRRTTISTLDLCVNRICAPFSVATPAYHTGEPARQHGRPMLLFRWAHGLVSSPVSTPWALTPPTSRLLLLQAANVSVHIPTYMHSPEEKRRCLRKAFVNGTTAVERKVYSQFGEDGIIEAVFNCIGPKDRCALHCFQLTSSAILSSWPCWGMRANALVTVGLRAWLSPALNPPVLLACSSHPYS
jgi:hypothetical protein